MAERRMFAKSVIGSARFLRMPPTSRLLYFDLGMQADDDGIVEAFSVMRTTGANEDDLRVLASKGFVRVLNEDLVTYISDWNQNNLIKKDRYHPSVYHELLVQMNAGTQMEPDWKPSGTQMEPEVRLSKSNLEKDMNNPPISPQGGGARAKKPKAVDAFAEFAGEDTELLAAFRGFEEMRKAIKKPLTDEAKKRTVATLQRLSVDRLTQIAILNQSEDHCWQGLFALKDQDRGGNTVTHPSHSEYYIDLSGILGGN